MAVRIDIPGIGVVEAEGVASEDTMLRILAAIEKANGSGGTESASAKATKENTKAKQENTKADKDNLKAAKEFHVGWAAASDAAIKGLKDFGLTATAVATKFMTQYADIAANPIQASRDLLNTGLDVIGNFTGGLAKAIPFVGEAASAAAKLATELLKQANNAFADQLQKNVNALQAYAKSGVSFSGGMQAMQAAASSAGLGIKDFSEVVSKNKDELNKLGMAGGDAAERLAGGMGAAAKVIGKSGQNLRTEMFKMGYQYDEQGAIFTGFMANMQAAGKLRAMSDKEIAEGTRQYAKDLKVIADLTGQDAKKLMERARAEAQRGALMNKLTGDQKTAFMAANSVLSKAGPEVQAALTQYLTFGNITDPKIAANKAMVEMVKGVGDQIKSGNQDMANVTQQQMTKAYKTMTTSGANFAEATDRALVGGVSGLPAGIAEVNNKFMAAMGGLPDEDAAAKSGKAADDMANSQDDLSTKTAQLYDTTKKFQVLMETKINNNLEVYAGLLEKVNSGTVGMIEKFINTGSGGSTGKPGFPQLSQNPFMPLVTGPGIKKYANGGKLGAGQFGIAGEAGPELISGPSTIITAKDIRENMAQSMEEVAKLMATAKNPFESALADVAWTPGGDMSMPYDKVTGTIIDPTVVMRLSEQSKAWKEAASTVSNMMTKDANTARTNDWGDMGDQETMASVNKQILEALQMLTQGTKDAAAQQSMHLSDMLKQMGISNSHLGKVAFNTN